MKKNIGKCIVWIIVILIITVPIGIVEYMKAEQKAEHEEMIKTVYKHKDAVEAYVKDYDKYHRVKSIQIDNKSINHNPMGGFNVHGYVNHDKALNYQVTIDKNSSNGKVEWGSGSNSMKLEKLLDSKNGE